ncbi:MAG: hypothetical protein K6F87_09525, partial [Lachnospiraceae bacterium]|nr:hypothetical protein [Lachnospiraceae bacterium]
MAQSTEDYLDSLLRQAMGIPDPESEKKPDDMPELGRDDVLAMAEGLTGSNSAILGNAYDHNASFTNEGEIEIPVSQTAPTPAVNTVQPAAEEDVVPIVATEDMPDPDAPVASAFSHAEADVLEPATVAASDMSMFTENLLPDIDVPSAEPVSEPAEPVGEIQTESVSAIETEPVSIPDGPVIEHDGNLDIIPEPENVSQEMFLGDLPLQEAIVEPPAVEEPV